MANKVVICGVDTSNLPKISSKEMDELVLKLKTDRNSYREKFVYYNMRLVLSIVQRFCIKKELIDDVFQVGVIGLLKAVDNFNTDLGVKFSTYAVPMIIGEIRRFLRDNTSVKVTRNLRDTAYKAMQSREKFNKLGLDATNSMISKDTGINESEIAKALDAISDPVSLYDFVYSDGNDGILLVDQLKDPICSEEKWLENNSLENAISGLEEREKMILFLRYFEGKTQMEISEEIGISQAQVSRLEKNALSYMKHQL